MSILTYGINYKTAPLALREQIAFDAEQTVVALNDLTQHHAVNEAVLLTTCHRTEIYASATNPAVIQQWLAGQQLMSRRHQDVTPYCYQYQDIDTVRHLMRVACGLDSMVLGEPQILGQLKLAYDIANQVGTVGDRLKRLFPVVFATSKSIRYQTDIGKNPITIAYAVVQLAKRIFSNINTCKVLLIGAGEIMALVATYLTDCQVKKVIVANRTLAKAYRLAHQVNGHAIRMGDIPATLSQVDIVISATASQVPILGKGMLESALKTKKRRLMLIADLAIPRDVEPEVENLEDVYLYNIDDLQSIIQQNLKNRQAAAKQAEALIEIQALHYMRQLRILNASDTITGLRNKIETLRHQALLKATQQLQNGKDPQAVIQQLSRSLTNKFLHQPTLKLREAAYDERVDVLKLIKDLFDL